LCFHDNKPGEKGTMQKIDHIVNLLRGYSRGTLNEGQQAELNHLLLLYPDLKQLLGDFQSEAGMEEAIKEYLALYSEESIEREDLVLQNILSEIRESTPVRRVRPIRTLLAYAAVAAVILLFIGSIFWKNLLPQNESGNTHSASDFAAGHNRAFLTAPDGKRIELAATHSGIVIMEDVLYDDSSKVIGAGLNSNGSLQLLTPNGGQYQITLSDGTKVWLNAASSLRFPKVFKGTERTVSLEGEAYFEVARNKKKPFIVRTGEQKISVLGTHFNVSAYRQDIASSVTLLEGKVRVAVTGNEGLTAVLKPGQQSVVAQNQIKVAEVNVDDFVAWKQGEFMFNNEDLEGVMQKLARWYDLEISVAEDLKGLRIWGSASRKDRFQQVLRLITATDERIKCKIEGRRVMLMR